MNADIIRLDERRLSIVAKEPINPGDAFAKDLTALCHKYGMGITNEMHLYQLDSFDRGLVCSCDADSRLRISYLDSETRVWKRDVD